jgi:signal transduction histidine kinase
MYETLSLVKISIGYDYIIENLSFKTLNYWNLEKDLKIGADIRIHRVPFLNTGVTLLDKAIKDNKNMESCFYSKQVNKWIYWAVQKTTKGLLLEFHDVVEFRNAYTKLISYLKNEVNKTKESNFQTVLNAQEEERIRIAETLHNEVGQLLAITHLQIDNNALSQTKKLLKEAIKRVRSISFELTPTILQDFGLEASLKDMVVNKLESENISCSITFAVPTGSFGKYIDLVVFRILQELLNNIVKHANANKVQITLIKRQKGLYLCVKDDGKGIDLSLYHSKQSGGFGLKSIRNRVKLLEGVFTIKADGLKGTKADIFIPLNGHHDFYSIH